MDKKVILISIDGMRADGLLACGNPYLKELEAMASYTYSGASMFPSVTFPCHFSAVHSVTPLRHGILTNTYVPEVRPITGLFERIKDFGGISAMYYGWEPLRDIARPAALKYATYIDAYMDESVDTLLTDEALMRIEKSHPDFVFLYMVDTDEKGGHDNGWMSEAYLGRISTAIDNVKRVIEKCAEEYTVIIMSDHGGHGRSHGTELPEDMVIPFFFIGEKFEKGRVLDGVTLLDIAPTITDVMGIPKVEEWEGKSLIQ